MRIFYGSSAGRADVRFDAPVEATLDTALSVLAAMDVRRGFLGVMLDDRHHLQFLRERSGVRVELLDSSIPAFDACLADSSFAESLLRAAAAGQDVFAVAKASRYQWEHSSLA